MKQNFYKYRVIWVVALLTLGSCTKSFDNINTNPVAFNSASFNPNYLLTTAELAYSGDGLSPVGETIRANFIYSSVMIQSLACPLDYWVGDRYELNEGYSGAYFIGAYTIQVKYVTDLVNMTKDKPEYQNLYQIARILKAMIFERITDLYGDIPYFQAGLGYYTNVLFPVYDSQEKIYTDLLKEVQEATAALNEAGDSPTGDAFYNGDIARWKRFGNTLLLRMAMRLVKIKPDISKQYAQAVIGKTMQDNDDNLKMVHDNASAANRNANSSVLIGLGGSENYYVKWSKTFIDFLKSTSDPRLGRVAATQVYLSVNSKTLNPSYNDDPSVQKGMPNGKDMLANSGFGITQDPSFTTFPDYSSVHPLMTARGGPSIWLTYGESELLLAEAAERWGIGGSAEEHYKNGVSASMSMMAEYDPALAIDDGEIQDYLNAHPYVSSDGIEMINQQYWILTSTCLNFYETWINWRRTGYPQLTPVNYPDNVTHGTIPRRFQYPSQEASQNPENFKVASDAVPGGDNLAGWVWWDEH